MTLRLTALGLAVATGLALPALAQTAGDAATSDTQAPAGTPDQPQAAPGGQADDGAKAPDQRPLPPELAAMDTDHDGKVSADELKAAREKRFEEADTNHDGKVDLDELTAFAEKQAEAARQARFKREAERMLSRLDTNHDGVISAEEATSRPTPEERRFDAIDTNHDGTISPEEFKAFEQMHQKMLREQFRGGPDGMQGGDRDGGPMMQAQIEGRGKGHAERMTHFGPMQGSMRGEGRGWQVPGQGMECRPIWGGMQGQMQGQPMGRDDMQGMMRGGHMDRDDMQGMMQGRPMQGDRPDGKGPRQDGPRQEGPRDQGQDGQRMLMQPPMNADWF